MYSITKSKTTKRYAIFICLVYIFVFKDWMEQYIPVVGYMDELFAVLSIPVFVFELKKNQFKLKIQKCTWGGYARFILVFLCFGFLSSVIYRYQSILKAEVSDAFLCIKFWLALYVGKKIFAKIDMQKYASKIYFHVKCITILYGVLIVIDYSLHIFQATERYGLRSEQLMYTHPTVLVACCVFLIMILLSLKNYVTGSKKYIIMLLLIMCSTLRSKAFGAALAIILICYFVFVRKKKITLRTMLLFIPLVVILGWDQIQYYFFSSIIPDSARYQLLTKAFEIARDMFPLGAGFATFGSYYSGVYYSSVYAAYGLSNINGLRIGASQFISDSFWPMILGQSGYFGLFSYIFAVMMLLKAIQGIRSVENSYYAAAMSGICYLIIVSMAESAFVHPIAVPIAMMIGAFLGKCE